jgi:5'-nucleotidase
MTERPLILITNDDGIQSPGLHAVAQAVADLGDLLIMAPNTQQTGAGRSYYNKADNTIHTTQVPLSGDYHIAYTANVSPAQAVALAVRQLAQRPINLCISGINYGENLGSGVTISGTVGAAIEAACFDIPALALSLETPSHYHLSHSDEIDFTVAAYFTRYFAQRVLNKGLLPGIDLLKIDIPSLATTQTGWRSASVSRQRYYQPAPPSPNSPPKPFSYEVYLDHERLEPDSDIHLFAVEKLITVVPMTIDMTARVSLQDVDNFFNETEA